MMPLTRVLFEQVAARHGVTPGELLAHIKPRRLLRARIELAQALRQRGYSGRQIGRIMKRDYTTVYYLLGRLTAKRPKLREPPAPTAATAQAALCRLAGNGGTGTR